MAVWGSRKKEVADEHILKEFNLREGLRPEDDHLPIRFHEEAIKSDKVITEESMKVLFQDYYRHRGWNDQGIPPETR
jgi:aldehyde:ferredoxin oxidoreductase